MIDSYGELSGDAGLADEVADRTCAEYTPPVEPDCREEERQ